MDQALPEESLEELYEHAPSGYLSTTADGVIVRVNATLLAWTGFERSALVHRRRFQEMLSLPGRIYYETHLGPLLRMQGSLEGIAVDLVRADGTMLPAMISAVRREPASYTRFTVFDATERRRYEKELLNARREAAATAQAKSDLLAMLSHDIRTPLGSIMAVAHLLERTPLSAQQAGYVRILNSSAAGMLTLLNDVLEHSKLEAAAVSLNLRPFDLRGLVRELIDNLQPLAHDKGITLACHLDAQLPAAVVGDPTKMAQVLGNLMGNALKFTEAGSVTLELAVIELLERHVAMRIRVIDTGIGIAPDQVGRIFQEYTQAHEGIARRYGGSGLGLAISRKLLRAQGSELRVESRPGEGSVFWFNLRLEIA